MTFYTLFPVIVAGIAVIMDLKRGKIDNGWLLFCFLIEAVVCLFFKDISYTWKFALGTMIPIFLLGTLFVFHMLGAADIKLLCVLGGLLGPFNICKCIFFSMLLGGVVSIGIIIINGNFIHRIHYFYNYINQITKSRIVVPYYRGGMDKLENYHFTVPIFMSVILYAGGIY